MVYGFRLSCENDGRIESCLHTHIRRPRKRDFEGHFESDGDLGSFYKCLLSPLPALF